MSSEALADVETLHGTVSTTRDFSAPPQKVFAGFADLAQRDLWFRMPGATAHELDFRVGGGEFAAGVTDVAGTTERIEWRSHIFDIAADRRLVFAYELIVNDVRRNVSLVTVELRAEGEGTSLTWTEQYAITAYDGDGSQDTAHLKGSLPFLFNRLEAALAA